MSGCSLVRSSDTELVVRHERTGHEFTFQLDNGQVNLGAVTEGQGPKDPGDVAADAHAFARQEAKRLGLV